MTNTLTSNPTGSPSDRPTDLETGGRVPAAQRGALRIDHGVVEKIATQAASELAAGGRSHGGLARLTGRADRPTRPRAVVTLRDHRAAIALTVGLAYPTPLVAAAAELRRHCAEQVAALTGLEVERVDVAIRWLGHDPVRTDTPGHGGPPA